MASFLLDVPLLGSAVHSRHGRFIDLDENGAGVPAAVGHERFITRLAPTAADADLLGVNQVFFRYSSLLVEVCFSRRPSAAARGTLSLGLIVSSCTGSNGRQQPASGNHRQEISARL
jgi:hypothetical protein